MLKKIFYFLLCSFFFLSWGKETSSKDSKKSGYRYIIDNYFSKSRAFGDYDNYSRHFTIHSGLSFYRESTIKSFNPFSTFTLGFNQKIKEVSNVGDLNLQISIFSSQLATRRSTLLEITPQFSVPEIRAGFPLYVGVGAGVGFYPRHIVKKIPTLSVNSQFFIGLRFLDIYHNVGFSTELNLRVHSPFNELKVYLETLGQFGLIFRF